MSNARKLVSDALLEEAGLPRRYWEIPDSLIDSMGLDFRNKIIQFWETRLTSTLPASKGLFFFGPQYSGKTVALALNLKAALYYRYSASYYCLDDLTTMRFEEPDAFSAAILSPNFLFVDDVGGFHNDSFPKTLRKILKVRYDNQKALFLGSPLAYNEDAVSELYGSEIETLIEESMDIVECDLHTKNRKQLSRNA